MKQSIKRVWTRAYRPFMMGGNVYSPIAAKILVEGPYDFGKGFKGYTAINDGKRIVIEARSGGLVGNSITEVRSDVQKATIKVMREQVKQAIEEGKKATEVSATKFWSMLKTV